MKCTCDPVTTRSWPDPSCPRHAGVEIRDLTPEQATNIARTTLLRNAMEGDQ